MKNRLDYAVIVVGILVVIFALLILMSKVAIVNAAEAGLEAHFFIRYDHTVQDENGSSHYDAHRYFPVGDVAKDYDRSKNVTDYTSVDGMVKTNSAYVEDAKTVIDSGEINLYHKFGATASTIKNHFKPVYDNILIEPSKEVIANSIERAMGVEMANNYKSGKIDVLWYVIKQEQKINVDGVLYWTSTGDAVEEPDQNEELAPTTTNVDDTSKSETKLDDSPPTGDDIFNNWARGMRVVLITFAIGAVLGLSGKE